MTEKNGFQEDKTFLIKKSVVRNIVHDLGGRVEPEFMGSFDDKVKILLIESFHRSKSNGRSTIMKRDL